MADYKPTIDEIKELRNQTGAGMNDIKAALTESEGDMTKAVEYLRKKGVAKGAKRSDRRAGEGTIGVYTHGNNSLVTLVELNCETDFVAKNEDFQQLAKDLAVHVAALGTEYIDREHIPTEIIEKEKEIALADAKDKPKEIQEKIVEGKLEAFYKEKVLLDQPFFKDDSKTVGDLMNEALAKIGEKLQVSQILTWRVGKPGGYCSIIAADDSETE